MERSWWWKAVLYGLVTVLAVLYLIPTVGARGQAARPSSRSTSTSGSSSGLDLQGGLHLVYEVQVDKAVSDKADRLATDVEENLHKDKGHRRRRSIARGARRHRRHLQEPGRRRQARRGVPARTTASRSTRSSATPPPAWSGCASTPNQVDELRDYALRQGIETIRSRVDKLGVAEPTIINKGTDIIVELPASSRRTSSASRASSAAPRSSSSRSSTTAREYMKKVAGIAAPEGRVPASRSGTTAGPRRTRASRTRTSTCGPRTAPSSRSSSPP